MTYNIYYEVSAAIFLTIVFVFHKVEYTSDTPNNIAFRKLTIAILLGTCLDVITACTISYASLVPLVLNYILNTAYFIAAPLSSYLMIGYMRVFMQENRRIRVVGFLNNLILILYSILALVSPFTKILFYFDENYVYVHGPLYQLVFLVPIFYLLEIVIFMLLENRNVSRRFFYSLLAYMTVVLLGMFLQMVVFPQVLLNFFAASISVLMLLFSMETPDYMKLLQTMDELEKAKTEAEEAKANADAANLAKSQFLANMSHEIRTPINGILGMDEIALAENSDPVMKEYLLDIQEAGQSLLSIVNDILDFSKVESGKLDIIPVEYHLEDVLSAVYTMIDVKAREKNLGFTIENDPDIPVMLQGDEIRVRQIILNLLSNAVKYTNVGAISLMVKYQEISSKEVELLISVKDTGIGLKQEDMSKLFQSFQRVDMKKNRNIQGTGLGLALVKQLAVMMEGDVEVSSIYGVGSEFVVRIRQGVVDSHPMGYFTKRQHREDIGHSTVIQAPGARVLVVDDSPMNLKVFTMLLKDTKMEIDTAISGMECLELYRQKPYDVIFLDHMMPEMDGIETMIRMQDMHDTPNTNTPVIMLTANAILGAKEEYYRIGFTDYITKPVTKQTLLDALTEYVPNIRVALVSDRTSEESRGSIIEKLDFLDTERGIMYSGGKEEFYIEILRGFAREDATDELRKAYEESDMETYGVVSHKVKSTAQTIGAYHLSEEARSMEHAAKNWDSSYIIEHYEDYLMEYQDMIERILSVIDS